MASILIWSPNYAPELVGIPPLVTDAAEWLAARGHRVDVVAPFPNYPDRVIDPAYRRRAWLTEERNGVRLHRHWLRVRPDESFLDKVLYEASSSTMAVPAVVRALSDADVVLCVVPTLAAAAYAAALVRRRRLVLWVQDLVVAAAASVSESRSAQSAQRVGRRFEAFAMSRADAVVVCSPGFADYIEAIGVRRDKIELIYNWADVDWIKEAASREREQPTFLYAGNLGYTQGFETLIGAAAQVPEASVRIVGAGNAEGQIRSLVRGVPNVTLSGPVPRAEFPDLLASADAHVVVQRRVSAGANLPSKIATYLASGRPVVASIGEDTPAAALLRESEAALIVEPESPPALANALRQLASDSVLRRTLGRNARSFAEARLSKNASLGLLESVLLA